MKKFLTFLTVLTMFSCNSELDKPIFEKLEVAELKKSIDSDSTFKDSYEYILYVRDTVMKSDMEKVEFADLTYERVHELMNFARDTSYFNPIREEIDKEWQDKYGSYDDKVDSISDYWKNYKEEHSLEKFVKIELVEIYKEYYSYSSGIKNVNLGFRITPLNGKIDQLRFSYDIKAKIYEDEDISDYSIYSSLNKSWCLTTDPITQPVTRYWEANYSNEKLLKSENIKTFNRDYNIFIEIDEIRKDGKNLSLDDLEIPEVVLDHWRNENDEILKDAYKDDIIIEFIDKDYIKDYKYSREKINEILKEEDPLAFKFINLPFEDL